MHPPQNQNPGIPCHFRHFFVDQINMELYSLDKIHFQPLTPNPLQNQDRSRSKTEEWQHPKKQTGTAREFFFVLYTPAMRQSSLCNLTFGVSFLFTAYKKIDEKQKNANLLSFVFVLLCLGFLLFRFVVFFEELAKQKKWRDLSLCHFSPASVCKLVFGCLLWVCGFITKPCKNYETCRYHWGKLRGFGHGLGNVVFDLIFNIYQKTMQTHRQPVSLQDRF